MLTAVQQIADFATSEQHSAYIKEHAMVTSLACRSRNLTIRPEHKHR